MSASPAVQVKPRQTRKVRIPIDGSPELKARLGTLCFESGLSLTEIGRYALWQAVLDAEGNIPKFCERVARARHRHLEQERLR